MIVFKFPGATWHQTFLTVVFVAVHLVLGSDFSMVFVFVFEVIINELLIFFQTYLVLGRFFAARWYAAASARFHTARLLLQYFLIVSRVLLVINPINFSLLFFGYAILVLDNTAVFARQPPIQFSIRFITKPSKLFLMIYQRLIDNFLGLRVHVRRQTAHAHRQTASVLHIPLMFEWDRLHTVFGICSHLIAAV